MGTTVGTPLGVTASHRSAASFGGPATIPNLTGWWDASDTSTFSYSNGTDPANPPQKYVSQWNDRSGLGNHALGHPTGFHVHPYRNAAKNINGLGTLSFDPAGSYATGSEKGIAVPTITAAATKPTTFFIVVRFPAVLRDPGTLVGPAEYGVTLRTTGTGQVDLGIPNVAALGTSAAGSVAVNTVSLLACSHSSAGWWVRKNGAALISGANGAPNPSGTLALGIGAATNVGAGNLRGDIGEVLVYSRALTTTERGQLETYLKTKWGTP